MEETMQADELRKLIAEEIEKDPTVFRTAIIPAAADSKVGAIEMVGTCFENLGLPLTKAQVNKLAAIDFSRAKPMSIARKWEAEDGIYTVASFPEWVIETIAERDVSAKEVVKKAAVEAMITVDNGMEMFCLYDGEAHFSKRGYQFLIMTSESRGWMSSWQRKDWQKDSGLFAQA